MSLISALNSRSDAQKPANSFDAQIKILERRIDAGVKNGTITADQADQIGQALDAVKQTLEDAGGEEKLATPDKVDINKLLRDIARILAAEPKEQESDAVTNLFASGDGSGINTVV